MTTISTVRRDAILNKWGYGGGGQPVIPDLAELLDDILATCLPFVSTEQTANGSAQSIAHGLGVTPSRVLVVLTELIAGAIDVAEGTHTSTNVVVTVTNTCKYKIVAWV